MVTGDHGRDDGNVTNNLSHEAEVSIVLYIVSAVFKSESTIA